MVMKIEDLKDTEFNSRYGIEIVNKANSSPRYYYRHLLDWMVTNDEWINFTVTVTFKNLEPIEASEGYKKAAKYEYEKRVLTKIKKRLCRLSSKWNSVIPIEYFFQYEYDQGSFFKPVSTRSNPHHIHGIFPVPKSFAHRIYDFENSCLDSRLTKDLQSLQRVSTFLIEPLRSSESDAWLNYILKEKSVNDFNSYWS
jgi:hypothetical protein